MGTITYLKTDSTTKKNVNSLIKKLLKENLRLKKILDKSPNNRDFRKHIRIWADEILRKNKPAYSYYIRENIGRDTYDKLRWKDFAAIRILDYLDNSGLTIEDQYLRGDQVISNPFKTLYLDYKTGEGYGQPDFYNDMIYLFRQLESDSSMPHYDEKTITEWMDRHPSGLDHEIADMRRQNRMRIINILIEKIDSGAIKRKRYQFAHDMSQEEKFELMCNWWNDHWFHLTFAIRDPELLNEMLGNTLDDDTMRRLRKAKKVGIPTFVNPYYLSLINISDDPKYANSDIAIRQYMFYSDELIEEFGQISAWEKEDIVEPGMPNAAGWLLPTHDSIHRRYPEVAILIPDTVGRACGGLCASCQRMYDFQSGHLNFNLDKLKPKESWSKKLVRLMKYYREDSQLRDILITGGDAMMSSDSSLEKILSAVYTMAKNKIEDNINRLEGEKYADILRVRLGTRLPVYMPQRFTNEVIEILADFKEKASKIGIQQFVIQTHFESAMEITPEARESVRMLLSAGWIVTNQLVFTAGASRRGHTAKLRKVLNDIGVLTYYTFSVKGFKENKHNSATNARAVQEELEEKILGSVPTEAYEAIKDIPLNAEEISENINKIRTAHNLPFLATDRNVINLPGVGKSLTFSCIGITRTGRRILEFNHDRTRQHSPVIEKMPSIYIIESKTMGEYIRQLVSIGEKKEEYIDVYGYSLGETEPRMPLYEYPEYEYEITEVMTNLQT